MIQKPARCSFVSTKGPSVTIVSVTPVVDDGGRTGLGQPAGENPMTFRLEPFVEYVDGRHLFLGGEAGRVIDHGNQVLHF